MNREPWICKDCGTKESEEQREFDEGCKCGGEFAPGQYVFPNNPVAKSVSDALINTPGTVACVTCGCRDEQRDGCFCKCHYANFV